MRVRFSHRTRFGFTRTSADVTVDTPADLDAYETSLRKQYGERLLSIQIGE